MSKKAKCLLVSLPDMQNDPTFPARMKDLADELEKVMTQSMGEPIQVILWNTKVEFVTPGQVVEMIRELKKTQKKISH